jgi:predicted ATPase
VRIEGPYPELGREHQHLLDVAWSSWRENGAWPASRAALAYEADVERSDVEEAIRLCLLEEDRGEPDSIRPHAVGLVHLEDPLAQRALEILDGLVELVRERWAPHTGTPAWGTIVEELGLTIDDVALARIFGPDLGLLSTQGPAFDQVRFHTSERVARSAGLEDLLLRIAPKRASVTPVLTPAPFDVRLEGLEAGRFRVLRSSRIDLDAPLTLLVGLNAAGKSTILDALAFVTGAVRDGLSEALDREAGLERIRTHGHRGPVDLNLRFTVDLGDGPRRGEYGFSLDTLGEGPVVERELLWIDGADGPVTWLRGRRAVTRVRLRDGSTEERFGAVDELMLPQLSDDKRDPVLVGVRKALKNLVLIDRDPALEEGSGFAFSDPSHTPRRRRAVTPLRRLLHEVLADDGAARTLTDAVRPFVPAIQAVRRLPRTDALTELEVLELDSERPSRFDELSAGVRQMLLLAALYVHPSPPAVVLLEEPDAALHVGAIPALRDLLRSLAEGTTVIATSHRPELVRLLDAEREVRVVERDGNGVHIRSYAEAKASREWLQSFDPTEAALRFGLEGAK